MKRFVILAVAALLTSCSASNGSDDGSEIAAMSDKWEAALNAGDAETLLSMYTDDARVMPPNAPISRGSQAVKDAFGGMIDAGLGGTLTSIETRAAGDIGYNIGTYELVAGDETVDRGKFIETWRRTADGWKISNDIWNSDLPPTGTGGH